MAAGGYPNRESHFAHRLTRLLTKSVAAQEIGPEACWLVTIIAHQEDAKRYKGAVTFWNQQLMPLCGFASEGRLIRARNKAVESGWLHYEPGGKGRPGTYWCLVPDDASHLTDTPIDESTSNLHFQNGSQSVGQTKGKRRANGGLPTLDPNPNPSPPSPQWGEVEEEARSFIRRWKPAVRTARRNGLSPEEAHRIIAHFAANSARWPNAGALHERLTTAFPGQAVEEGWPDPSHDVVASTAAAQRKTGERVRGLLLGWVSCGRPSPELERLVEWAAAAGPPQTRKLFTSIRGHPQWQGEADMLIQGNFKAFAGAVLAREQSSNHGERP